MVALNRAQIQEGGGRREEEEEEEGEEGGGGGGGGGSRAHSGGTGRAVARLRNGVDDLTPRSRAGWSPLRSAMLEDCLPSGPVCRAVCRGAVRAVRRRRVQRAPPGARELLVRPVASAAPVRRAVRCRPRPQGKGSPRRGRIPLLVP
ncbi:unnamed protein product, partial [Prorocentrum cordatum]